MIEIANDYHHSYSQIWFCIYSMFPTWSDWSISYTRQGTLKKRTKAFVRSLIFLALFSGALKLGRNGKNWTSIKPLLQSYVKTALFVGAGALQAVGGAL